MENYVALVTGGASGIGLGVVSRFLKEGARVVIMDLPTSRGSELAVENGEKCMFYSGDVTKLSDVSGCIDKIKSTFGKLDIVVNSAGIGGRMNISDETASPEDMVNLYETLDKVHAEGTYSVICHAVRLMKDKEPDKDGGRGVIINIGSVMSSFGVPGSTGYAGTKGCMNTMTLGLARDLAGYGIRVVTVEPGIIDTALTRAGHPDAHLGYKSQHKYMLFPKRAGTTDELASLVYHIVENKYINATVIRCDAGHRYCCSDNPDDQTP